MILETKNKTVKLVLKTRKILEIANTLKNKNFEDAFFKMVKERDLDALSKVIYTLADKEEKEFCFKTSTDVLDFIDDYKSENDKSYDDIFKEIAEVINEEGFFNKKMEKEEIEQKISNSFSQEEIEKIVKEAVKGATTQMANTIIAEL